MSIEFFGIAFGKVQNVMFRQTLIRGAISRGLKAGASNDKSDRSKVSFTLKGEEKFINDILTFLSSGKLLNDWGASCTEVKKISDGKSILEHQVNTENVDKFNWNPNCKMYL